MSSCCHAEADHLRILRQRQTRVLQGVLAINAVMFVIEFVAGWLADSTALLGDSLDMLGDALVYGLSLFVLARGLRWKALAAAFKGGVMALFGVVVLADVLWKLGHGMAPEPLWMAAVGALALVMNTICFLMINRHRSDDINLRSAWVCSRNDLMANTGVLLAAGLVFLTANPWPDVVVGVLIAALFLRSAAGVLRESVVTLRSVTASSGSA